MTRILLRREVEIPDPIKLMRYRKAPELGPKILFFSGGSALKKLSMKIVDTTYNSIHIITPFDSGGSSAELRKTFGMPAIGDVRNRLMALADHSLLGNPQIFSLFAYRLSKNTPQHELLGELKDMAEGSHPMISVIENPMRKIIRTYLYTFIDRMPQDFNLSGASLGNLVLSAGYLENRNHFDPVIYIFSKLVNVRGTVSAVVNKDYHLKTELVDGTIIIGQHLLTGKERPEIHSPVKRLSLVKGLDDPEPVEALLRDKVRSLIDCAELIVFPMGSFYSSLIANLLPKGVARAIRENPCPKVFIPNTGKDPESLGLTITDQVRILLDYLLADGPPSPAGDVLDFVLIDSKNGRYPDQPDPDAIRNLGAEVIDCSMITEESQPYLDENLLVPLLLSLT